MDNKTTLGYWGFRGLAQPLRFLLEYLEVPYEEKKYTDRESWAADKAELLKTNPLANIPYYKDGDNVFQNCFKKIKYVFESDAIGVYIASKANRADLLGTTAQQQVALYQVKGVLQDFRQNAFRKVFGPKESFDKNALLEAGRPYFEKLEFLLKGHTWATGDSLTLIDFVLYETVDFLFHFDEATFNQFPNLVAFRNNFRSVPQIQAYVTSDRFTERPFFPPQFAAWY